MSFIWPTGPGKANGGSENSIRESSGTRLETHAGSKPLTIATSMSCARRGGGLEFDKNDRQ